MVIIMATDTYIAYGNFNKNKIAGHLDNPQGIKFWRVWNLYRDYDDKLYYAYPNYYGWITIEDNVISYATHDTVLGEGRDVWVGPNNTIYYSAVSSNYSINQYLDENNVWRQKYWRARSSRGTYYDLDNDYHEAIYPRLVGKNIVRIGNTYYTTMSYVYRNQVISAVFYLSGNIWTETSSSVIGYAEQWKLFYVGNNTYCSNSKWTYDYDTGKWGWKSYQWQKNVNGTVSDITISYPWKINGKWYTVKGGSGLSWAANKSIAFYRLDESTLQWVFIGNRILPSDFPGQDNGWWLHTFVYNNALYYTNETDYFIQIPLE